MEFGLRRIADASERGQHALFIEAEHVFAEVAQATKARVLVYAAGAWRAWDDLNNVGTIEAQASRIGDHFVVVRTERIGVSIATTGPTKERDHLLASLAIAFDLGLLAHERRRSTAHDGELDVLQRLALRILKSQDLQEILLLLTHETRRLFGADICGIMLREGDEVVMQRCVGNFSPDTATLRMQAGQGVAGRVLVSKRACHVEDYVASNEISNDFMNLARVEMVRSALAAPLLSQNDVIGVLEVWRREVTAFTEYDTQRLVALANLTSLAVENARLAQARESVVAELATTNAALLERYESIRASVAFQNDLVRLQLEGRCLDDVAAKAAAHLDAEILIVDVDLKIEGAWPQRPALAEPLGGAIRAASKAARSSTGRTVRARFEGRTLLLQSAIAGSECLGFVALVCEDARDEGAELGLSQIAIAASLHLSERRATARARSETLSAVLWDILEGSESVRTFALARARDFHIRLEGEQWVFLCAIDGIEAHAASEGWSAAELAVFRRRIENVHRSLERFNDSVRLCGMRGNLLALVCAGNAGRDPEASGGDLARSIAAFASGLCARVGISLPCLDGLALEAAHREARISLEVARQRGAVATARYEDAGIVGLLLSLRDEADIAKLVRMIFGRLLDEKPENRDMLLGTLDAFFNVNCSRQATAKRLGVHEKTVAYRLAKIESLTSLDFALHEKRLLADIALRMHGMTARHSTYSTTSTYGRPV
jgi:sugar diacid utilization regulator/putative methionine-R-sulfoxide reductase with GAF domain